MKTKWSLLFISLLLITIAVGIWWVRSDADSERQLKIYTYSSFVSAWGPGRKLQALFETQCNCVVHFIESADAGLLLQRLELEGPAKVVDVVIGFDQLDIQKAQEITTWRTISASTENLRQDVLSYVTGSPFVPFDWGPLTFVYRQSELDVEVRRLEDLLSPGLRKKVVLEDPRISSPGFQFLIWLVHHKGIKGAKSFLKEFLPQTYRVAPSWSQAYGLFQEGHASLVWSYQTSPLAHRDEADAEDYKALVLEEAMPVQVELMGIPSQCVNCELAEKWVEFMLSPQAQKIIMEHNFMLPVLDSVRHGSPFEELGSIPLAPIDYQKMNLDREEILKLWTDLRQAGG